MGEFVLVSLYLKSIIKSKIVRKLITYSIFIFLVLAIYDSTQTGSDSFDSLPTGLSCILILTMSIFYLFEQMREPDNLFLYSSPHFWIVVGIIIFFSGTFFVFIFSQNSLKDPNFEHSFNLINSSFGILKNLIFSIAFIIKPGKSSDNSLKRQNSAYLR